MPRRVTCGSDTKEERYGFLWLKRRQVRDWRLTKMRTYDVHDTMVTRYGNKCINHTFVNYLIIDDTNTPQWISSEAFL